MDENGLATDLRSAGRRFEYADACTSRAETMTGFAGDVRAREHMAGNVWEWTESAWSEGGEARVIRGRVFAQ